MESPGFKLATPYIRWWLDRNWCLSAFSHPTPIHAMKCSEACIPNKRLIDPRKLLHLYHGNLKARSTTQSWTVLGVFWPFLFNLWRRWGFRSWERNLLFCIVPGCKWLKLGLFKAKPWGWNYLVIFGIMVELIVQFHMDECWWRIVVMFCKQDLLFPLSLQFRCQWILTGAAVPFIDSFCRAL